MLMQATKEKIQLAADRGYLQGFVKVVDNAESLVYEHPNGMKQSLGCLPGSLRVRYFQLVSARLLLWVTMPVFPHGFLF